MTVKEIIIKALRDGGFDGLFCEACGCESPDIAPCCLSENILSCEPGYKVPCPEDCGDHEFHISSEKAKKPFGECTECKPCQFNQVCPHSTWMEK